MPPFHVLRKKSGEDDVLREIDAIGMGCQKKMKF
jgi:hypothetical protein